MKYMEWLRDFELLDPEPKLDLSVANEFNHKNSSGELIALYGDLTYSTPDVDRHIGWHRRMTNAYMKMRHRISAHEEIAT